MKTELFSFFSRKNMLMNLITENPHYNDSFCYQSFCCKIKFAVIKKLDMDTSKAWITDIFEQFFYKSTFCVFVRII